MNALVSNKTPSLRGTVRIPGDKSISHRAVMLNAAARGSARVTNFAAGADCASTVEVVRALDIVRHCAREQVHPRAAPARRAGRGGAGAGG